jgi:hypothetical protein
MHGRLTAAFLAIWTSPAPAVLAICLIVPLLLGCMGLGLQIGPLGLNVGAGEPIVQPAPPPPRAKKETTVTEEPDGTLRQEGEISVPPRACASVYYLRRFVATPHLEVSEPDVDGLNFLITEQKPDHFTIKNTGLLCSRTFTWRAREANAAPHPMTVAAPLPPPMAVR